MNSQPKSVVSNLEQAHSQDIETTGISLQPNVQIFLTEQYWNVTCFIVGKPQGRSGSPIYAG